MEEIEERFPIGNDSLASYWIHDAIGSCETAWAHCWSEKTSKKIIEAIENLKKIETELVKEEKI